MTKWTDLRCPEFASWQIRNYELYPLLGLKPGAHLPIEGFSERIVTDRHGNKALFKCEPADLTRKSKRSTHRLFYSCPDCAKWIPFGRAFQHKSGKEHKRNERYNRDVYIEG